VKVTPPRWSVPLERSSWIDHTDVSAVVEALGAGDAAEGVVLLRLVLKTPDDETGAPAVVGSFLKRIAMPRALVGPEMKLALQILGERRVLAPTVLWDDAQRACILEIEWVVGDDRTPAERCGAGTWMA
jgi:hypothetical protein